MHQNRFAQNQNRPMQQQNQVAQKFTPNQARPANTTAVQGGRQPYNPQVQQRAQSQPQAQPQTPARNQIRTIASLNPYHTKSWVILARVSYKSPIKTWSNERGEGKLFSLDLLDASGEIRCTLFNDSVDTFYDRFQTGKAYYISKGQVKKVKNKKFSSINNDFEMSLSSASEVSECTDDSLLGLPLTNYNPVKLLNLEQVDPETIVDAIVILRDVGEAVDIVTKKDQRQLTKRALVILDDTAVTELTLWGDDAKNWSIPPNVCLAIKNARVTEFSGKSLTASSTTRFEVAPKHEWVDTLSSWYTMQTDESLSQLTPLRRAFNGGDSGVSMNTPSMSLEEGKIAAMQAGAPVYFRVRGTLVMMKHDENQPLYYFACPGESCGKKVSPRDDGTWFCERCNHAYPVMQPRYILSLVVSDYSGRSWCNAFNDAGKLLLGIEADGLKQLRESNDPLFEIAFRQAVYQELTMKMKAVEEVYNDEPRVKCTVVGVDGVNFVSESEELLKKINQYRQLV